MIHKSSFLPTPKAGSLPITNSPLLKFTVLYIGRHRHCSYTISNLLFQEKIHQALLKLVNLCFHCMSAVREGCPLVEELLCFSCLYDNFSVPHTFAFSMCIVKSQNLTLPPILLCTTLYLHNDQSVSKRLWKFPTSWFGTNCSVDRVYYLTYYCKVLSIHFKQKFVSTKLI